MASSLRPSDWAGLTDEAFKGDLSELGWRGKYKYSDPEVVELRSQLDQHAGIPDMELVDPATPGFAQRATFLLNRDGVRLCLGLPATRVRASGPDRVLTPLLFVRTAGWGVGSSS